MPSRNVRLSALLIISALVVAACSGESTPRERPDTIDLPGQETQRSVDPALPVASVEMSAVTAEPDGDLVRLSWQPVDGAHGYRVGDGAMAADVPAVICGQSCTLAFAPDVAGDGEIAVRAVTADGLLSEPYVVTGGPITTRPDDDDDGAVHGLEVVLIHGGDADDPAARPEVEVVPVSSTAEADQLIADAGLPESGIVSASLNTGVSAPSGRTGAASPADETWYVEGFQGTWQTEAMRFDLLPGEPRGSGVVIGLVEPGGVDASHPALNGAVHDGVHIGRPGETGVSDPSLHATATASLIVGQPAGHVPGVAPGATIVPVPFGDTGSAGMVEAIIWAVDYGVDIINISAATTDCTTAEPSSCPSLSALDAAAAYAEQHDVIVVASAGNNGPGERCGTPTNAARAPAVIDTVISVGAYGPDGLPWACSASRPDVEILTPGARLLHADPGGGYGVNNGTSFAAPLMTGFLAALKAELPWLTPQLAREMLPQWRDHLLRLDVAGTLVGLGLADPEDTAGIAPDGVSAVYPYEIGLGFEWPHPIADLIWDINDELTCWRVGAAGCPITSQNFVVGGAYWQRSPYNAGPVPSRREEAKFGYGVITGLIYLHDDGSATATAHWDISRLRSPSGYSGTFGLVGGYAGHGVKCHPTPSRTLPAMRVVRWELPVVVDVTPVQSTNLDGLPEVEMTISLGEGATVESAGRLPVETVVHDTWDQCGAQIDATRTPTGKLRRDVVPWDELEPVVADYFQWLEQINHELVDIGPMTLENPVVLGKYGAANLVDDSTVVVRYTTSARER